MTERDILAAVDLGESKDWGFKSAKGGLPGSLWETYSAMANTDGGAIVLGVEQRDRRFTVSGLPEPALSRWQKTLEKQAFLRLLGVSRMQDL